MTRKLKTEPKVGPAARRRNRLEGGRFEVVLSVRFVSRTGVQARCSFEAVVRTARTEEEALVRVREMRDLMGEEAPS